MSLNATKVAVTRRLPANIEERMAELFDTKFNETDQEYSRAQLAELMAAHDVLVPTVADVIDSDLINGAGDQLKLIANFGNGTDNIDVAGGASHRVEAGGVHEHIERRSERFVAEGVDWAACRKKTHTKL